MGTFHGNCKGWRNHSTHNGEVFSAEEFNGTAEYEVSVKDGKPARVEIDSSFDKGDLLISIKFATHSGETRAESFTSGQGAIALNNCKDGTYILTATAKDVRNVSVKYTLI